MKIKKISGECERGAVLPVATRHGGMHATLPFCPKREALDPLRIVQFSGWQFTNRQ